jgi:hypothetical protein
MKIFSLHEHVRKAKSQSRHHYRRKKKQNEKSGRWKRRGKNIAKCGDFHY